MLIAPVHLHRSWENRTKAGCSCPRGELSTGNSTKLAVQLTSQKNESRGCSVPVDIFGRGLVWSRCLQKAVRPGKLVLATTPSFSPRLSCSQPVHVSGSFLPPLHVLCEGGWMECWMCGCFLTPVRCVSFSGYPSLSVSQILKSFLMQ